MGPRRVRQVLGAACCAVALAACTAGPPAPAGVDDLGSPPRSPAGDPVTVRIPAGEDIQAAVDSAPPGSTFVIGAGVHREQVVRPRDGDVFAGEEGAVMTGTRVLTDLVERDGSWVASGQTQMGFVHGTTLSGSERVRHPEDVWVGDQLLRHVASPGEVGPGTWHFDYDDDEIWIGSDPTGQVVETSTAPYAFVGAGAARVTIRDLVVQRYANRAQRGAISPHASPDWVITDVVVQDNHSGGIGIGPGVRVERAVVRRNGQIGLVGSAPDDGTTDRPVVVRDVSLVGNGHIGFDWRWEAGGTKFKEAAFGVRVERVESRGNTGPGIWFDIGNRDVEVRDSVARDNTGPGLFYEISFGDTVLAGNEIAGNGSDDAGVAVRISSSSDVSLRDNDIVADQVGVLVQQGDRVDDDGVPWVTRDVEVVGNDVEAPVGVVLQGIDGERIGRDLIFRDNRFSWAGGSPSFDVDGSRLDLPGWQRLAEGDDVSAGTRAAPQPGPSA